MRDQTPKITVLVLDDSMAELKLLGEIIKEIDPAIHTEFFQESTALLSFIDGIKESSVSEKYLIFTDWNLIGHHTQEENVRKIKEHPMGKSIPLVVMSNYLKPDQHSLCYSLGADWVMDKPENFEYFLRLVKNVLRQFLD